MDEITHSNIWFEVVIHSHLCQLIAEFLNRAYESYLDGIVLRETGHGLFIEFIIDPPVVSNIQEQMRSEEAGDGRFLPVL